MTKEQDDIQFEILAMGSPTSRTFELDVGHKLKAPAQEVFDLLLLRDWVRLINIGMSAGVSSKIVRVFRIMPDAVGWLETQQRVRALGPVAVEEVGSPPQP